MYEYKCILDRVVDGDTVDVHIDLGFGVWMHNQRVRLAGIDCPETRTLDLTEKAFGFAAKQRVVDLTALEGLILYSQNFEGKFGRILGDFGINGQDKMLTEMLLEEGHAVLYELEDYAKEQAFLANRARLVEAGKVVLKDGKY
jgi:micrococcal nuclease